jgi:hypothetical protein
MDSFKKLATIEEGRSCNETEVARDIQIVASA